MQDRKRETADALQNVGGDSSRKRRAITHITARAEMNNGRDLRLASLEMRRISIWILTRQESN